MSAIELETGAAGGEASAKGSEWAWRPPLPMEDSPVFAWPPNPLKALAWFGTGGFVLSFRPILLLLAAATWLYLQPALERCAEFRLDWIAQMFVRNLGLMVLVAGGLHLYFYTFRKQGDRRRFDARELVRNSRTFLWRDQVWDNVFWSLASGVTVWTAFEALFMWAFANGIVPFMDWTAHPVWFTLWFLVIPIWQSMHFYWTHRLLHWKPLYKAVHAQHHRNVNIGPWSGISMHPIEHVVYFSSVLIHWVLLSHPVHVLFHMQYLALEAVLGHAGFESLLVKDRKTPVIGSFFHQLHHRYFECNYGDEDMPWDRWFGSFHDGTPEATRRVWEQAKRAHQPA